MLELLNEKTTVREVAARVPAARRVFENHGIDYCCGGLQTLEAVAEEKHLDVQSLRSEIEKAQESAPATEEYRDWYAEPLDKLADHIEATHHAFMREQLPRLRDMAAKVVQAHGANHGDVLIPLQQTYNFLSEELEMHLMKEEQILFPYIRKIAASEREGNGLPEFHCGSVENPIAQMQQEHEDAGEALGKMRALTSNYTPPADACPTLSAFYDGLQALESDLHKHIHLENNILFPRAIEMEREA